MIKLIPLETLVKTNPDTSGDLPSLTVFYAESWAPFHYLYKFPRNDLEEYILAYRARMPLLRGNRLAKGMRVGAGMGCTWVRV